VKVPLLDLKPQYRALKPEIDAAILRVSESQYFILGPEVKALEAACAAYSGCKFGIGLSSGTDALLIALMALDIGAGDEVITSPYTFFATAGTIARVGARPVFVDIEPGDFNIAPAAIERFIESCESRDGALINRATGGRVRAIIPVHLYGQMADMDGVMAVANKHKIVVIEDGAQAIGAEDKGRRAGSIGHYGCLSFFPSKNLGCAGDGGMVVTNDVARAEKLALLRAHGSKPKYYHKVIGGNFRLDSLQAAIVSVKLRHLDKWTAARQQNAARYDKLFAESGIKIADSSQFAQRGYNGVDLYLPKTAANRHIFNQYIIRSSRRDALKTAMEKAGIATEIYYPVPMHEQECFAYLGQGKGAFPQSESAARETVALPVYPELEEAQARYVVQTVCDFFKQPAAVKAEPVLA
jgi:dTDP-4-amino-4,6-dideoxygalactose transaminase